MKSTPPTKSPPLPALVPQQVDGRRRCCTAAPPRAAQLARDVGEGVVFYLDRLRQFVGGDPTMPA